MISMGDVTICYLVSTYNKITNLNDHLYVQKEFQKFLLSKIF